MAEVRARDAAKPHMRLTNWPGTKVRQEDVSIAKNYPSEPDLAALNNLVEQYLLLAEAQDFQSWVSALTRW